MKKTQRPRSSAASAASPASSTPPPSSATSARCSPPPRTAWAPRSTSPPGRRVRHHRPRPGRDGHGLHRGVRRRAALHDRLHLRRQGPPGARGGHREGHRRGLCARGLRPGGRRDGRTPGFSLGPDDFDVAGAGTGVVEADRLLGPDRIRTGDAVIAMAASGLHSNGYSLVRHVLFDRANLSLDQHVAEFGPLARRGAPGAHQDLLAGLPGADEDHRRARLQPHHRWRARGQPGPGDPGRAGTRSWTVRPGTLAPVFDLVGRTGEVERLELEKTLNMGVGMIAIVPEGIGGRGAGHPRGPRRGRLDRR